MPRNTAESLTTAQGIINAIGDPRRLPYMTPAEVDHSIATLARLILLINDDLAAAAPDAPSANGVPKPASRAVPSRPPL